MIIILYLLLAGVTLVMALAILVQEPKQAGLSGSFGMGGEQMLGAGSPNAISKFTTMLAIAFLVLCLAIGLLDQRKTGQSSIEEQAGDQSGLRTTIESSEDPAAAGAGAGAGAADGTTDGATDGLLDGATDGSTDGEG